MPGFVPVPMYDPSQDRVVEVHPADVEAAKAEGLTLETKATAEDRAYQRSAGLGEAAKAFGEGALSGASLGLSDVALSELGGDEYREGRERRKATFGALETAGNITGTVLPTLLSGGESLLAKGASLAPTTLAARLAGAAEHGVGAIIGDQAGKGIIREAAGGALRWGAAGLVEGALAGAGSSLSEAALADHLGGFDDVAERAWAGAKAGSLMGLFGGAALGGVAGAAMGAGRGLARRFAQSGDELADFANERAVKALDPRGVEVRKLGTDAKIQQVGEDLREYHLQDGTPLVDLFDDAESIAPKVARARQEVGSELGEIRQRVAATGEPVDALNYVQRIDQEIVKPLIESTSPTIRRQGRRVMGELENLATRVGRGEDVTYGDLLAQNQALQAVAYPKRPRGQGLPIAQEDWTKHLQQAQQILEDEMEGHVEHVLGQIEPDSVSRYTDLKRMYESFTKADTILQKSVKSNLGNRYVSLTDYLTGLATGGAALATGHPVGMLGGLAVAAGHKFARERGSATLAALYTRVTAVDAKIDRSVGAFFKQANARARTAEEAAAGEAIEREEASLAAKVEEATAAQARDQAIKAQEPSGGGEPESRVRVKRAAAAAGGELVGDAVGFDVRKALRTQHGETPTDAYDRIVARAAAISQGQALGPYMLDDVAPRTGNAMRAVQVRAAQHLLKNAPVPPRTSANPNLGELAGDRRPDPVALYDFARRVAAIDDPTTLLDDLRHGTISMAAAEAVREVHPKLFAAMQARVLDHLGNATVLLPYEERIRLGIIFQLPTDQTLTPAFLQVTQSIYQQNTPSRVPGVTSAQMTQSTKRRMSESERLEAGM